MIAEAAGFCDCATNLAREQYEDVKSTQLGKSAVWPKSSTRFSFKMQSTYKLANPPFKCKQINLSEQSNYGKIKE